MSLPSVLCLEKPQSFFTNWNGPIKKILQGRGGLKLIENTGSLPTHQNPQHLRYDVLFSMVLMKRIHSAFSRWGDMCRQISGKNGIVHDTENVSSQDWKSYPVWLEGAIMKNRNECVTDKWSACLRVVHQDLKFKWTGLVEYFASVNLYVAKLSGHMYLIC